MHFDLLYKKIDNLKNSDEVISRQLKTQMLNTIKTNIDKIERKTLDTFILDKLSSLRLALEDAYHIDMYVFQWHIFSKIIRQEVTLIEEILNYATRDTNAN